MMIVVPGVLDSGEISGIRARIEGGDWIDGNATSGHQSALAKHNRQLDEGSPIAREVGAMVLDALARSPVFVAAALPLKVYPPLFNRYDADGQGGGDAFGTHVDSAIRIRAGSDFRIRTDLSATLFLADTADYDGGELVIEDPLGPRAVKLPAGDMLLYPATSLHHVAPVTRGSRIASFLWCQSMVRDAEARRALYELDVSIQELGAGTAPDDPAIVRLTGVYHNLLRRWATV